MQLAGQISVAATLAVLLGLAAPAQAVSLQALDAGASLDSLNGVFRFESFSASVSGALPGIDNFDLTATQGGFELTGPLSVSALEFGTLLLDFEVTLLVPGDMDSARLFFSGVTANGTGSLASVIDTLLVTAGGAPVPGDSNMSVTATGDAGIVNSLDTALFVPRTSLHAEKNIVLVGGPGGAGIGSVRQSFALVPEPETGLLVLCGLAVLAARRRPHSH